MAVPVSEFWIETVSLVYTVCSIRFVPKCVESIERWKCLMHILVHIGALTWNWPRYIQWWSISCIAVGTIDSNAATHFLFGWCALYRYPYNLFIFICRVWLNQISIVWLTSITSSVHQPTQCRQNTCGMSAHTHTRIWFTLSFGCVIAVCSPLLFFFRLYIHSFFAISFRCDVWVVDIDNDNNNL